MQITSAAQLGSAPVAQRNQRLSTLRSKVALAALIFAPALFAAQSVVEQPDQWIDAFLAERTFNVVQRIADLPQDVLDLIEKRQDGSIAIVEPGDPWHASNLWHVVSGISKELAVVVTVQNQGISSNVPFVRIYDRRRRAGVACLANLSAREWDGSNHNREMFRAALTDGSTCRELGTWLVGIPPRPICGGGDPRYSKLANPDAAYSRSDVVFVGEVVDLDPIDALWTSVTVRVTEQLKRDIDEQVSLAVRTRDISCHVTTQGTRYMFFAGHRPRGRSSAYDEPSAPWDGDLILGATVEVDSTYAPYLERLRSALSRLRVLRDDEEEREIVLRRHALQ
jgi:hypothetical protein